MLSIRQNPREVVQSQVLLLMIFFKIDEDREKLPPEKAVVFHNLVAKTLYATKMSQTQYLHSYCILNDKSASTQQG
jgi:hypothetical protein